MEHKSANQILLGAANLLEEEGKWNQGSYFLPDPEASGGCSMCAHGAIAYCGNSKVKAHVDNLQLNIAYNAMHDALCSRHYANNNNYVLADLRQQADRECLSTEEYLVKKFGEVGLAHFKACRVGLYFSYNDNDQTTKQDIVNKLREAATK